MKALCYGFGSFCVISSVIAYSQGHLKTWLALTLLSIITFVLGFCLHEVHKMKPKIVPIPFPSHGIDSGHEATGANLEILPSPTTVPSAAVPDIFDENRIRQDLATFANAPGLFEKYIERARSRFNKAGEKALLEHWISYYATGRRLIESRTEMERARSNWLQLANEHELGTKQKDAEISKLQADMAESNLRRDMAEYKRQHIEQFVEGAIPPATAAEPKLSPAQQRLLKKAELEQELQRLKLDETSAVEKATTETEKRRLQNMYATRRDQLMQQLEKHL